MILQASLQFIMPLYALNYDFKRIYVNQCFGDIILNYPITSWELPSQKSRATRLHFAALLNAVKCKLNARLVGRFIWSAWDRARICRQNYNRRFCASVRISRFHIPQVINPLRSPSRRSEISSDKQPLQDNGSWIHYSPEIQGHVL